MLTDPLYVVHVQPLPRCLRLLLGALHLGQMYLSRTFLYNVIASNHCDYGIHLKY